MGEGVVVVRWFKPKTHTGWRKSQSAAVRRRRLWLATDPVRSRYERYLMAARKIQALANVTRDPQTRMLAKLDADYFFTLARSAKHKRKEVIDRG